MQIRVMLMIMMIVINDVDNKDKTKLFVMKVLLNYASRFLLYIHTVHIMKVNKLLRIQITMNIKSYFTTLNHSNKSRCPKPYEYKTSFTLQSPSSRRIQNLIHSSKPIIIYHQDGYKTSFTLQSPSSYITKTDTKPHSLFKSHHHISLVSYHIISYHTISYIYQLIIIPKIYEVTTASLSFHMEHQLINMY